MAGLRTWLTSVLTVSLFCAAAEALMPPGAVRRVGKLVCGLALLCGVLWPVAGMEWNLEVPAWSAGIQTGQPDLEAVVKKEMKEIIEERCAAYIVDKAAELGVRCSPRVSCRADGSGLWVPDRAELAGPFSGETRCQLTALLERDLAIPPERQTYIIEEASP